eukprot:g9529.t1
MAFNFGGGGAKPATTGGGGLFGGGNTTTTTATGGGGLFGGGGAKPATTGGGGLFGGGNTTTTTATGGGGLFGGGGAKPATTGGGGLFGGGNTTTTTATGGGGLFGGGGAKPATTGGGGLFGGGNTTTTTATGGGGLFGGGGAKPATTGGGGLFGGGNTTTTTATSGGGFGGGFQLNNSTNSNNNSSSIMQKTGQHLNSIANESRPQLETLTVEDIVTEWEKRISDHERNFQRTVSEMKDFDNILFRVHNRVMKCSDTVFELRTHCGELKEGLESMEKFQDQVDGDLDLLEQEVKRVIAAGQSSSTTADKARESNYKLAEQVDREVINMMVQIQDMTKKLNSMEKVSDGQGSDFSQIIKIVDRQQRSLEWLNAKANELENAMQHADALVTSQQRKLFVEKSGMR